MAAKPTTPKRKIEPPSTWSAKTDHGFAKTVTGVPLVRLEDVHAWLVESKDMPSASAAARVFSVFVFDTASELGMRYATAKVRSALHILDPVEHPFGYGEFAGRQFFTEASRAFPYVPNHHLEAGTEAALFYAMGLAAPYVWGRTASDGIEGDLNRQLDGYCPEGEFQSHAVCRAILNRLAVSQVVANALWGWGGVKEVVPLRSVSPVGADADTKAAAAEWTGEQLAAQQAVHRAAGHKDFASRTAKDSGLHVREVSRRISASKAKKVPLASVATVWGSGTGKKSATAKKR